MATDAFQKRTLFTRDMASRPQSSSPVLAASTKQNIIADRARDIAARIAANANSSPVGSTKQDIISGLTRDVAARMATPAGMAKGGAAKKYAKGGKVSSASKRADGCAAKGKTKGKFV